MIWLLLLILAIVAAGFFAGYETGFYSFNRLRVRVRARRKHRNALLLLPFLGDPESLICVTLVGHNAAMYLAATLVTVLGEARGFVRPELTAILLLAVPGYLFAETLPKSLFRHRADAWTYHAAGPMRAFYWLFFPVVWGLKHFTALLRLLTGGATEDASSLDRQSVRFYLATGQVAGALTPFQNEIAGNILNIHRTRLGRILTPMAQVRSLSAEAPIAALEAAVEETGFSRFPVYEDDPARVIGRISVADHFYGEKKAKVVRDLVRPVLVLGPSLSVPNALLQLQQAHEKLAVVGDKAGAPLGIVALTDLLEEIVGEMSEEAPPNNQAPVMGERSA